MLEYSLIFLFVLAFVLLGDLKSQYQKFFRMVPPIIMSIIIGFRDYSEEHFLQKEIFWGLTAKLFSRDLFTNVQMPKFLVGEDAVILYQILQQNKINVYYTDLSVYNYFIRSNSAMDYPTDAHISDIFAFHLWIYNFNKKKSVLLDTFLVRGYIQYLLFGGNSIAMKLPPYLNQGVLDLKIWEKLIITTRSIPIVLSIVQKGLRFIRKMLN